MYLAGILYIFTYTASALESAMCIPVAFFANLALCVLCVPTFLRLLLAICYTCLVTLYKCSYSLLNQLHLATWSAYSLPMYVVLYGIPP